MKENKEQQEFVTFRFYNSKGQRLTIYYNDNIVTVLPCNIKDQFSKQIGKSMCQYEGANMYPTKEHFAITFYKQKDFLDWCRVSYFKQKIHKILEIPHNQKIIIKNAKNGIYKDIIVSRLYKEKTI